MALSPCCPCTGVLPACKGSAKHKPSLLRPGRRRKAARPTHAVQEDDSGSTESAFQRELKRRGITGDSLRDGEKASTSGRSEEPRQRRRLPDPPRFQSDAPAGGQLERSRALNSEGLEGLIPRASKLAQLGLSFWLGLYPIILGLVGVTIGLYAFAGSDLVHGGNQPMKMPSYVPQELLYSRNSEPMVPYGPLDRRGGGQ